MFLIKNDNDLSTKCGFLKNDITSLNKLLRNILMEQNEEYLDHIKNQGESIIQKFLNKYMENDNCYLCLKLTISKN